MGSGLRGISSDALLQTLGFRFSGLAYVPPAETLGLEGFTLATVMLDPTWLDTKP